MIKRLCFCILSLALVFASRAPAQTVDTHRLEATADSLAEALLRQDEAPGYSIAVGQGDSVVFAKGYGEADIEMSVPAGPETRYNIASGTKQFTAAAVLKLIEQGRIGLDDPITRYLPDYPTQGHDVTIRNLLNHTSGIESWTDLEDEEWERHWEGRFRLDLSYEEMLDLFAREPFDFAPGEGFE